MRTKVVNPILMAFVFFGTVLPTGLVMRAPGKDPVVSEDDMIEMTAQALANQQAVGWFQGRMEFGPRALGLVLHPYATGRVQ